jgi:hypothetical protein
MRAARARGWAIVGLWLAFGAWGGAQEAWTVQTVALRDLREAESRAAILGNLGLPAYTEFTMNDGLQFVRVRIGCFSTREVAEAWADVLQGAIVDEAVAVPIEGRPPAGVACVVADIGFRKPSDWSLVSGDHEQATFLVVIDGSSAYLRYEADHWRMWQSVAPEGLAALPPSVVGTRLAGRSVVRIVDGPALCPGRLLAASGEVAIVEIGDFVAACHRASAPP